MQGKVIAVTTKNGGFYRIGETFDNSDWYSTEKVKDVQVNKRDIVEYEFVEKKGKKELISISVSQSAPSEPEVVDNYSKSSTDKVEYKSTGSAKPNSVNESIRKQTIIKAVAETVKVLNFDSPDSNLEETIERLYKKYDELSK